VLGGSCGVSTGCGPLEDYAAEFDELFSRLAQRRGFRDYLTGLLAPRDRNKTLTGLAGSEPVIGAQHAAVQRLRILRAAGVGEAERGPVRQDSLRRVGCLPVPLVPVVQRRAEHSFKGRGAANVTPGCQQATDLHKQVSPVFNAPALTKCH
jgi:hypothetical protein